MAAKEIEQFDDKDNDYGELQKEGAALIELVDHEVVKLARSLDFVGDEILVVRHADLRCGQLV